ncbi:PleD family two-component system response regulator [Colwellia sp. C1TZA3]|uniref:response regulator n=1 Tax=Colwellia sp. C1TZA3 TaxID=2508879 RepID=UPI0011B9ADA3|nr:response regulator [Colwellia sp. C1TZA3]TWX73509.1 response regulator [Colwellia sp. C1TZA3]
MKNTQKILIVDDRKENLIALRLVLSDLNLDVEIIEASNGNDALAATLQHRFSLAILDIMMPGMDGYELASYLRGDEKTKLTPIIFVSAAHTDEQDVFKGYEVGGIDYIVKPIVPQILLGKVKLFLEMDRYREALAEKLSEELERRYTLANVPEVSSVLIDTESLSTSNKEKFQALVQRYSQALMQAVENLILKVGHPVAEQLRAIAQELGKLFATSRDVAELHSLALARTTKQVPPLKAKAIIEEGRFVVLEVMGNLSTYYRQRGPQTEPNCHESTEKTNLRKAHD